MFDLFNMQAFDIPDDVRKQMLYTALLKMSSALMQPSSTKQRFGTSMANALAQGLDAYNLAAQNYTDQMLKNTSVIASLINNLGSLDLAQKKFELESEKYNKEAKKSEEFNRAVSDIISKKGTFKGPGGFYTKEEIKDIIENIIKAQGVKTPLQEAIQAGQASEYASKFATPSADDTVKSFLETLKPFNWADELKNTVMKYYPETAVSLLKTETPSSLEQLLIQQLVTTGQVPQDIVGLIKDLKQKEYAPKVEPVINKETGKVEYVDINKIVNQPNKYIPYSKPEKPPKPEMTEAEALEKIAKTRAAIARLKNSGKIDSMLALMNPNLAPLVGVNDQEAINQAIVDMENYIDSLKQFISADKLKKLEGKANQNNKTSSYENFKSMGWIKGKLIPDGKGGYVYVK